MPSRIPLPLTALLTATALALLWLATPASAGSIKLLKQGRTPDAPVTAAALMDIDRNGLISRDEFELNNAHRARWQVLDADQNGVLDVSEQQAVTVGPRGRH